MREIKFRAKPRNALEIVPWVYGDYLTIRLDGHPTGMIHQPYELFDREPDDPYTEVIESTLGQFTGLRDKNGKEIYEGDILLVPDQFTEHILDDGSGPSVEDNHLALVEFNTGSFGCNIQENGDYYKRGFVSFPMMEYDMAALTNAELEVIGNIYENPELLEKA